MLRVIVILFGIGLIVGGLLTLAQGSEAYGGAGALFFAGALFIVGTIFEARRYRPKATTAGNWEATGERFVDPTSGKLTGVRYNPDTGQREYVDES